MKLDLRGTWQKLIFLFLPVVTGTGSLSLEAQSEQLQSLKELLRPDKLEDYRDEDYHDRIEILRQAIEQNAQRLEGYWKRGQLQEAQESLEGIRSLCEYALLESNQETDPEELRDREVKKLEIVARRLSLRLEELKRSLPFPEQAPFDSVIKALEQLREQLLKQLFGGELLDGSGVGSSGEQVRLELGTELGRGHLVD